MAIRYETKDAIPADEQADFVPFKEGDKEVFVHKEYADAKREQFRLQGDLTKLNDSQTSMKTKLDELAEAERTRQEALDEERRKGLTETQRLQEQVDNLKKGLTETQQQYDARVKAAEDKANKMAKDSVISDVAAAGTEATRGILRRMAAADIETQPDGTFIVLDENGKATAQTIDEYKASLAARYPALVSAVQSKGGQGKGGAGGGADGSKLQHGRTIPGFAELPVN